MNSFDELQRADKRRLRAHALTANIMHIVGKYVRGRHEHRDLANELMDMFEKAGAEIVSDYDRQEYGLPPRGPDGWTQEEICELDRRRLEVLRAPMVFPFEQSVKDKQ